MQLNCIIHKLNIKEKVLYKIVKSQLGDIGIVWQNQKIIHIFLPGLHKKMVTVIHDVYKYPVLSSSRYFDSLCKEIEQYLEGKKRIFSIDSINLSRIYSFQKRVLLLERKIPYGWISTYGRLAKKLGIPKGAQAIGQALARNPFPIIIPCHRTIMANGSLGGFQGGLKLKRRLLEN